VPLDPAYRRARRELPKIYILVDVSRSMEMYAQLFLRVARAFCEVVEARAFVFHTRLVEITELLKKRTDRVQEKINAVTFGFGGGTRIATSLNDFVHAQARTALSGRSIVLVFSDGYDTDPPEALGASPDPAEWPRREDLLAASVATHAFFRRRWKCPSTLCRASFLPTIWRAWKSFPGLIH